MTRRLISVWVFVVLIASQASAEAQSAGGHPLAQQPDVAAALQVLEAWVASTVATRDVPGLAIGIVHDQDLIWTRGYGFADVEKKVPVTPATVFRIASISKVFTATAIMQLRDAGKLKLDEPLTTYLPWFTFRNAHPDGPTITIRHLLTHTSGLPRELAAPYWNEPTMPSRDEALRMLGEAESVFPAERQVKYSNLGYAILGEVVSAVSGEPYAQYVEDHVLKPLGMAATLVTPRADTPGLAVGYALRGPDGARAAVDFLDLRWLAPAGNLASTVEDLAKFVSLQFRDRPAGGVQILKGATLREMRRVQWLRPDWRSGQGLGFSMRRTDNVVRVGHGGLLPGQPTLISFAPSSKLGVIVLTNGAAAPHSRVVDQAFSILNPVIVRATETPRRAPAAPAAWDAYVGTYAGPNWIDSVKVMILNGQLAMVWPSGDNPWSDRVILRPIGADLFRMQGGWAAGELARFEADAQGRVTRLLAGNVYWNRK